MSLKFGLNLKKNLAGRKKPLLDDDDDDIGRRAKASHGAQEISEFNFDESPVVREQSAPVKSKKNQPPGPPTRKHKAKEGDPTIIGFSASAQESERRAKEAVEIDASIYDYDAAYDALHAGSAAKKAAEREEALQRKPKYMDSLFESAEQRKKDQLRARDKLLQREREAEGDEFADKEKFITGAYKAQQEEARQAEEEEKKRNEAEEAQKRKFGMQGFHKQMLMEQEKRHQEAIEATAQALKEGIKPTAEVDNVKTDIQLAEELRKQGKTVSLNEDGQVTDKRQLLNAGLNIIAKSKPASTATAPSAQSSRPQPFQPSSRPGRNAQRERQTQMVAEQIELASKRKAEEEAEELSKLQHASKSQKSVADISSAKERYLQRKREAAAAAKEAAGKK